jgi:hypothetical protein
MESKLGGWIIVSISFVAVRVSFIHWRNAVDPGIVRQRGPVTKRDTIGGDRWTSKQRRNQTGSDSWGRGIDDRSNSVA